MERLNRVLNVFTAVTTCTTIAAAVYGQIFTDGSIFGIEILWQILLVSFLCSIETALYPDHELSKRVTLITRVLNYIYVNLVVLGCGFVFKWFEADRLPEVLFMEILILIVFLVISIPIWSKNKKEAEEMNDYLYVYQQKKEEQE